MDELLDWLNAMGMTQSKSGSLAVTYVVDPEEKLWIAERRSEHVACAGGGAVLAAGEVVFVREGDRIEVVQANNLSTGYCPEPECWGVLAIALDRLGIPRPAQFSERFDFRRCRSCGTTNVIKDGVFECAFCGFRLDRQWNYGG